MSSVLKNGFECKVSSVLNRDTKQFGKKFMFDGSDETCWNSAQGSPQYVSIQLPQEAEIDSIVIQFQGGFVGQNCIFSSTRDSGIKNEDFPFYPEDVNTDQTFVLPKGTVAKTFSIIFNESTDFFGRIVIYKMDVLSLQS